MARNIPWKAVAWLAAWTVTTVVAYALGLTVSLGLTGGGLWLLLTGYASQYDVHKRGLALLMIWGLMGPTYLATVAPLFVMLGGAICGALQGAVLRRRVPDLAGWGLAMCFGWLGCALIGAGLWWLIPTPEWKSIAIASSCGLIIGSAQRGALPPATPLARWWVPLMLGAVLLGALAGWCFWWLLHASVTDVTGWGLGGLFGILVAALLNGLAILVIPHRRPAAP